MKFGSFSPRAVTWILFIAGLVLLGVLSAQWAWDFSATVEWSNVARDGWKEPITTYNIPKAVVSGVLAFLGSGAVWRIFCDYFFLKYSYWYKNK